MFVDLVGSTALSAQLDPEEMGDVLRAYQNAVAGEILRFEGHVAKFMGDGVLAYFGWPVAHEDEAERAVRAGLAIVAAVARLSTGDAPLACRIGMRRSSVRYRIYTHRTKSLGSLPLPTGQPVDASARRGSPGSSSGFWPRPACV
jgi:class 3 adenylate cyclase